MGELGPGDMGWRDDWGEHGIFWWDEQEAEKVCQFIEKLLKHRGGEYDGKPFLLLPWQREMTRAIFGWKRTNGLRRISEVFLFVASGAGKSAWLSAVLLYCFYCTERGVEIYNLAGADRTQAHIVFDTARAFVEDQPILRSRTEIFRRAMRQPSTGSTFQVLSTIDRNKAGLRPYAVGVDEVWVLSNTTGREALDLLKRMAAKRRNSLILQASTAGYDVQKSVCGELYRKSIAVRENTIIDPNFLPVIFEAPPDSDWRNESTWRAACPSLGVTVKLETVARECRDAQENPSLLNSFLRQRCNIWTEQYTRWLSPDAWDACAGPTLGGIDPTKTQKLSAQQRRIYLAWLRERLRGRPAFAGIDLSTTTDLTAVCFVFPPVANQGDELDTRTIALWRFYMPEEQIPARVRTDNVRYDLLAQNCQCTKDVLQCTALLHPIPGPVVDYELIRADMLRWNDVYPLTEVAIDPYQGAYLFRKLQQDFGEQMVLQFRQGFLSMSPAVMTLERALIGKNLIHGGDPLARMCFTNVALQQDPAGNRKFNKARSAGRIDGIVALAMALHRSALRTSDVGAIQGAVLL